jgi:hypothetical protein
MLSLWFLKQVPAEVPAVVSARPSRSFRVGSAALEAGGCVSSIAVVQ